jgi:hypothetical protein
MHVPLQERNPRLAAALITQGKGGKGIHLGSGGKQASRDEPFMVAALGTKRLR